MKFLAVSKEVLLAIAGAVWFAAGFNITRIGILAYANQAWPFSALLAMGSVLVFLVFWFRIFSRMLGKHVTRIAGYGDERQPFWRFFDKQAFIIMAIMMTGGIALRAFSLVPEWFIASFYTGLGCALALAGVGFFIQFIQALRNGGLTL